MICQGQSIKQVIAGCNMLGHLGAWVARIVYCQPRNVLELGTGQGASGARMMSGLPAGSKFTTVNYDYPASHGFGEELYQWLSDGRLTMLSADTVDPATVDLVTPGVDFLFIDTHHEAWVAATELRNFQRILEDEAIVIVDDLSQNDMQLFWASIPYEKVGQWDQGVFRYDAGRPYDVVFPRGRTPKEDAGL